VVGLGLAVRFWPGALGMAAFGLRDFSVPRPAAAAVGFDDPVGRTDGALDGPALGGAMVAPTGRRASVDFTASTDGTLTRLLVGSVVGRGLNELDPGLTAAGSIGGLDRTLCTAGRSS